jgi:hypothetical protein
MDTTIYNKLETELVKINIDDMLGAFGLSKNRLVAPFIRGIFELPARKFARHVLQFDYYVAEGGLAAGAQAILPSFIRSLTISGKEHFPLQGPLLLISNHPGLTDTLALFASLPRPDLRILAAVRPFLRTLPAISPYLLFVPEEEQKRGEVVRQTVSHLRSCGAVLTFPAGKIEPDPQVLPGALESLEDWSSSTGLFVRLVPGLQIVPVMVRGVIAERSLKHPLTYIRRDEKAKQRLAASLQIAMGELFPHRWPVDVQVTLFPAIDSSSLASYRHVEDISRELIARVGNLYSKELAVSTRD